MKIIEALKLRKELLAKANDLREKIKTHCAYHSVETPVYGTKEDQTLQVSKWLQSHSDILHEIARLGVAIAKTNLSTVVQIELGGTQVSHPITEWVLRRRELATLEQAAWAALTDRGLKEGEIRSAPDSPQATKIQIVRCYDPKVRDEKVALFSAESGAIDRKLEIINAVTDLME